MLWGPAPMLMRPRGESVHWDSSSVIMDCVSPPQSLSPQSSPSAQLSAVVAPLTAPPAGTNLTVPAGPAADALLLALP